VLELIEAYHNFIKKMPDIDARSPCIGIIDLVSGRDVRVKFSQLKVSLSRSQMEFEN